MSLALDLGICTTSVAVPRMQEAAKALAAFVAGPFTAGSAGDIVVRPRVVDGAALSGARLPPVVGSDMLHQALEAVTGRQRNRQKVTQIGLLLAGEYAPRRDFFGYMFDEPFVPGSSAPGELTPREGCAVFLDAIARKRQGADFLEEVLYTGVHELGHLFNQQHSKPSSFMARSAGELKPYAVSGCAFDQDETKLLKQCSTSRFIWPGGSAFGILGDLAHGTTVPDDAANGPGGIALRLAMDRDAFWPFEPVELDVTLALTRDDRSRTIPDLVDPGYEAFVIWIEEPSGERRRYRSPRHYCPHDGRIRISPSAPFRRDISIFGESGSYAFRQVGLHRVWAQFRVSPGRIVRSNVLEVEVRPPGHDEAYHAARRVLTGRSAAQLLYYRRLTPERSRVVRSLNELMEAFPRRPVNVMAQYAIGRSLAERALSLGGQGARSHDLMAAAQLHLRRAARSAALGEHRRAHAERALERLSATRIRAR